MLSERKTEPTSKQTFAGSLHFDEYRQQSSGKMKKKNQQPTGAAAAAGQSEG